MIMQEDMQLQLFFKNHLIGYIHNMYTEHFWIYGSFEESIQFQEYRDFFKALVCEDGFCETEFDCELLDDTNWRVKNNEVFVDIYIPAIYEDGEISFRYR